MYGSTQQVNCTGAFGVESCGIGEFCCLNGCCIDFLWYLIILVVFSMIFTTLIFIHIEVVKQRVFDEKLRLQKLANRQFSTVDKMRLGDEPIQSVCAFKLPPSCTPPLTVPRLKLHKNWHFF
ncbi:unnamed protein product [Caenorhabditis angaria]|uniref:Uncharacterized protein n=1 Tax=Caenorhabditis angaria TaxID=860376 RepID=A0A9P1IWS0_9PELO|nr:unnamed protein product [Caenorhabditis angaria]